MQRCKNDERVETRGKRKGERTEPEEDELN